jgi:hypothetical protein
LNEADLINLFIQSSQALDSNFEFWLTASFALLVASYLVTEEIPYPVFWITTFLYVVSTVLFMLRGMTMGRMLTSIRDQLAAMNSETALISADENLLVALLYFVVMITGTATTIAFVYWRFCKLRNQGGARRPLQYD